MNEKRVLLAAMLSAIFLSWYSQTVMRGARSPTIQPAAKTVQKSPTTYHIEPEDVIEIESSTLRLEIGRKSGAIRQAVLKKFPDASTHAPLRLGSEIPLLQIQINGATPSWGLIESGPTSATLGTKESDKLDTNSYQLSYTIDKDNSLVNIVLTQIDIESNKQDVSVITSWGRADKLTSRQNILEVVAASDGGNGRFGYKRYMGSWRGEKIVPRGTAILSLSERYFCESIKPIGQTASVKLLESTTETIVTETGVKLLSQPDGTQSVKVVAYIGPRDYFYLKEAGFESAFHIGMLGKIGLMMLLVLSWLAGLVGNYGVAIILFSGIVTGLMSPFTLLGFRSMKKMQELKPRVDQIMAQHKNEPQRVNRELFALYKEHKVSPLSGCLPMFIQFPVFIALFQAISHYVELRGRPFLWIKDLSLPDHVARLPFSIPILGEHLNLLPIVMAVAMYIQTKMSQANMAIDPNNPTAKMMSGPMMSVLFGFMFYQFPSGLVLYWLTNSLFSLAVYKTATTAT